MDKYLGCLFSFRHPHPHMLSWPSCRKESGEAKGVVPWVSVPLMPTWDQPVQKCFCGLFPAQCCGSCLWQSHPHGGYLPPALCSLTIFLSTLSFASSPFPLQLFPVPRSRARWSCPAPSSRASSQASACAASSSPSVTPG